METPGHSRHSAPWLSLRFDGARISRGECCACASRSWSWAEDCSRPKASSYSAAMAGEGNRRANRWVELGGLSRALLVLLFFTVFHFFPHFCPVVLSGGGWWICCRDYHNGIVCSQHAREGRNSAGLVGPERDLPLKARPGSSFMDQPPKPSKNPTETWVLPPKIWLAGAK